MQSKEAPAVKVGVYRHFKGNTYHVLGVAVDESGAPFVSYIPQYGPYAGKLSHRPLAMFIEHVDKPEVPYSGPRFALSAEEDFLTPLVLEKISKETGREGAKPVHLGRSEHTETHQQFILSAVMVNGAPQELQLRSV